MQVEYYFDCSSPWTYLSFNRVIRLCKAHGAELVFQPFLVGGVFNTVNPSVYAQRETPPPKPKAAYYRKDLADWARYCGLNIGQPAVFPVNSVKAMRGCFYAQEEGRLEAYAALVFERYWSDLQDISSDEVIRAVAVDSGLDGDEFMRCINRQEYKDRLRANTEALIARGGFGSPTFFVDGDDMYFGNDRLELVAARLKTQT